MLACTKDSPNPPLSRRGQEEVTASCLLDEITHSLRHHHEPDFRYHYVNCGLTAFVFWLEPNRMPSLNDMGSRLRRKVRDLEKEIESILAS